MVNRVRYLHERGPASSSGQFFYMKKFGVLIAIIQITFIVLFAIFVRYGEQADPVRAAVGLRSLNPVEAHDVQTTTTDPLHGNKTEKDIQPLENFYPSKIF